LALPDPVGPVTSTIPEEFLIPFLNNAVGSASKFSSAALEMPKEKSGITSRSPAYKKAACEYQKHFD